MKDGKVFNVNGQCQLTYHHYSYSPMQCRVVKITITGEPIPVQVDGEAWMQTPGYIKIVQKNRAQMLVRDRVSNLSYVRMTTFHGNPVDGEPQGSR